MRQIANSSQSTERGIEHRNVITSYSIHYTKLYDTKVTDMLYSCYDLAAKGKDFEDAFKAIQDRYYGIISDLGIELSLQKEFDTIKACFIGKAGRDYAASRGEYLNGIILAKFLGYTFVDPAEAIFFTENGNFDSERTNTVLGERLSELENAVRNNFV